MKRLFYLCLIVALYGCEKETSEVVNYPSTLIARDYHVTSDVKLFTRRGQINDDILIRRYIEKDTSGIFYPNKASHISLPITDTVIYQTRDTVIFSLPGEWGKRLPKQVGDYIYFCMPDTLVGFKTLQQEGPFNEIIRQIGLFKPYYEEVAIGSHYQMVFDAFIAKGHTGKLEFPYIIYRITRRRNHSYYRSFSTTYNNVFDPNVVKLLEEGDTLAIQEANLIYIKLDK